MLHGLDAGEEGGVVGGVGDVVEHWAKIFCMDAVNDSSTPFISSRNSFILSLTGIFKPYPQISPPNPFNFLGKDLITLSF